MQALPIGLALAGTAASAGGTILGANNQAKELRSEAGQLDQMAGQDRASSQRSAIESRRQSRLLQSRALALAAASGGGVNDPTVVNLMANLEGEGEYRALSALYEGDDAARTKELEARARRREAKNTKKAALIGAAGNILQAGATMYDRYG